jgi:prepilin-type N-terminal cleavage/methylation domain-containing protein
MKILPASQICPSRGVASAFTLIEVMAAVSVFALLTAAMIATQFFGFRMFTLASNRGTMTTDGRQTVDQIRDAIRQAQTIYVGSCSPTNPSSFVNATNTQSGSALQIFSTTNATPYVIYYLDNSNGVTNYLKAYTVPASGQPTTTLLAAYITNTVIFYAENYQGVVLNNNSDNRVINVVLQFYQFAYSTRTGVVNSAYQLRTRATQRILN